MKRKSVEDLITPVSADVFKQVAGLLIPGPADVFKQRLQDFLLLDLRMCLNHTHLLYIVHFKASWVVPLAPPFLNIYYWNQTKKGLWIFS